MPSNIKIESDNAFLRNEYQFDIGTISNVGPNLSYNSASSSYYNPCYLNVKKVTSIAYESFSINTNLLSIKPRNGSYEFKIPIRNLNAKDDLLYYSMSNPKQKQKVKDIYWGFIISTYDKNYVSKDVQVWIHKELKDEAYPYIDYNVNNEGWKNSYGYPNCESEYSSYLKISGFTSGTTWISWGDTQLFELSNVSAINKIEVLVGCQAEVKFGKATLDLGSYCSDEFLQKHYQKLSELLSQEKYSTAKYEALRFANSCDGVSTESNYYILAFCQLMQDEFDDCIKIATALINFKGDFYKKSLLLRGYAKEGKNDLTGALSDYASSGDIGIEAYNSLSQKLKQNNEPLQKSSSTKTQIKPALTK